ncbi:MAG TPA: carboxymuconolactone decarboxylase family protein [Frateuria sp.]|uniref:carboxymuconolactone decarboxylase family protein n=1 Tax=Frateuria sp. TaxID=2211372 RepID=UPI002D80229A|nr:carboxymuconolactone decarboxylase family protein [Frateuria sp.]HET6803991.1 carboxymuconolactone decarboxylase family protein [Frateuria sp.]
MSGTIVRPGDVGVIQTALALEHEGIAAYCIAGKSGLLSPSTRKLALVFMDHHQAHRDETKHQRASMNRIDFPATADGAPATVQGILAGLQKKLGFVPNLHRLMSVSPHVLAGWSGLTGHLGKTLDLKTRESIALAISQANGCDYCLAAHAYVASTLASVSSEEIALNREGRSADPRRAMATAFAQRVVQTRGQVADEDIASIRAAGYSDANIVEIVACVAQYLMTNLLNNVARTVVDFPAIDAPATTA